MHSFGKALRGARLGCGLSQDELGALIGVSGASVSAWERDQVRPSFDNLLGIHAHLSASLDVLMLGRSVTRVSRAELDSYVAKALPEWRAQIREPDQDVDRVVHAIGALPVDTAAALADFLETLAGNKENSHRRAG